MPLTDIDPALSLLGQFSRLTGGVAKHLQRMRQETIFSDGAVAAKYKALGAVLWAINARCEPCITFYVRQAIDKGASENELGEFLAVASTMGGCVGELWALKAFKAYKDIQGGRAEPEGDHSCCR